MKYTESTSFVLFYAAFLVRACCRLLLKSRDKADQEKLSLFKRSFYWMNKISVFVACKLRSSLACVRTKVLKINIAENKQVSRSKKNCRLV